MPGPPAGAQERDSRAAERGEGTGLRRIALLLEYDGSRYGGSQIQKNAPTVQQELEEALYKLTGERHRVAFAGRTDAGVHACGQVASFLTPARHEAEVFRRGLNHWLPDDIAVKRALEAPPGFDPRRQAEKRLYRYLVYNGSAPSPLLRNRAWHVADALDATSMARAAECLAGRHDFASFAGRPSQRRASTVRTVYRADVSRKGDIVVFSMEADAFLPHQVRRTVGALVEVGLGRMTPDEFEAMLRRPETGKAGPAAPAHGLYLARVTYRDVRISDETENEDIQR